MPKVLQEPEGSNAEAHEPGSCCRCFPASGPHLGGTQACSGCIHRRLCDSPPKARCSPLGRGLAPQMFPMLLAYKQRKREAHTCSLRADISPRSSWASHTPTPSCWGDWRVTGEHPHLRGLFSSPSPLLPLLSPLRSHSPFSSVLLMGPPRRGLCPPGCPGPVGVAVPLPVTPRRRKAVVNAAGLLRSAARLDPPGKAKDEPSSFRHSWKLSSLSPWRLRPQHSGVSGQGAIVGQEQATGDAVQLSGGDLACPRAAPGRRERSPRSWAVHPWPTVQPTAELLRRLESYQGAPTPERTLSSLSSPFLASTGFSRSYKWSVLSLSFCGIHCGILSWSHKPSQGFHPGLYAQISSRYPILQCKCVLLPETTTTSPSPPSPWGSGCLLPCPIRKVGSNQ